MRIIKARNVNGLFNEGMHLLDEVGVRSDSRAGPVMVAPWPVMSVYEEPCERVLFEGKRDANPFFHLMEGLWMLAGRNDAAFLNRYVSNFGERFGEKDGTIHDAYGDRWRVAFGFDQLNAIVGKLRANPQDRQCVLTMWDPYEPHSTIGIVEGQIGENDFLGDWRGRPCNTHVYFRVRDVAYRDPPVTDQNSAEHEARITRGDDKLLDMTICCRSNDIVWGAYGANAVHFSMLLEYMAGRIGASVGTMYQLSNNLHGYSDVLAKIGDPLYLDDNDPYDNAEVYSEPMATDWNEWDADLGLFMKWHDADGLADLPPVYANDWFKSVAERVARARWEWTHGMKPSARKTVEQITAPDWRMACVEWMERRAK